jgi:hypothetical protein
VCTSVMDPNAKSSAQVSAPHTASTKSKSSRT